MKLIFSEVREGISTVEYHGKPSQTAAEVRAYFDKALSLLVVDCTAKVQRTNGSLRHLSDLSRRVIAEIKPEGNRSAATRKAIKIADIFYGDMECDETRDQIARMDTTNESNECPF